MREIKAEVVTAAVRQLCITANKVLPEDLVQCIGCARRTEPNSTAKSILGDLENNLAACSRYKSIHKIRNHIQNLGKTILILYIYKLGRSILDDKYCTRCHLTGKTASSVVLLVSFKSSGSHTERYINKRKNDGIAYMNGIAYNRLGRYKSIHSLKQ